MKRVMLVIVALVAVGAIALSLSFSHLIKRAVEREGTASLRLATTLEDASVSLIGGTLGLRGLSVASPPGFAEKQMLEAGEISLAVHYGELRSKPLHVESLVLARPRLVLEQAGGALNLRKAMELTPAQPPSKEPLRLVIDELQIVDALVVIRPGLPGVQEEVTVPIPELTMHAVGRGKGAHNGAAVRDVVLQVSSALALQAAQSDEVPAQVRAVLRLALAGPGLARNPGQLLQRLLH